MMKRKLTDMQEKKLQAGRKINVKESHEWGPKINLTTMGNEKRLAT